MSLSVSSDGVINGVSENQVNEWVNKEEWIKLLSDEDAYKKLDTTSWDKLLKQVFSQASRNAVRMSFGVSDSNLHQMIEESMIKYPSFPAHLKESHRCSIPSHFSTSSWAAMRNRSSRLRD